VIELLTLLRWAAGGLLGLFWLYSAVFNGVCAWRRFAMKQPRLSILPLAGGIAAVYALWLLPIGSVEQRLRYLGIPLVLDFGAVPAMVIWGIPMLVELGLQRLGWRRPRSQ
jgi:hypothetical protein